MYFVDENLSLDLTDQHIFEALKLTSKSNTLYIERKSDALFLLHILKTFVKKRLKKAITRNIFFSSTESILDPPKTADVKLKKLHKYKYCEGIISFSKFSENNQTYLKMQCTDILCYISIYKVFELFNKKSIEYETKQELIYERQSKKPCNFELVLSEFKAEFYIEVLSRIKYF